MKWMLFLLLSFSAFAQSGSQGEFLDSLGEHQEKDGKIFIINFSDRSYTVDGKQYLMHDDYALKLKQKNKLKDNVLYCYTNNDVILKANGSVSIEDIDVCENLSMQQYFFDDYGNKISDLSIVDNSERAFYLEKSQKVDEYLRVRTGRIY
jgi:hypothetical protein